MSPPNDHGTATAADMKMLGLALAEAAKSNCIGLHTGTVLADPRSGIVAASGHNGTVGAARGDYSCTLTCGRCRDREAGRVMSGERLDACSCIHGEASAVADIVRRAGRGKLELPAGSSLTAYVVGRPCLQCAKLVAATGLVGRIVHVDVPGLGQPPGSAAEADRLLARSGVVMLSVPAASVPGAPAGVPDYRRKGPR